MEKIILFLVISFVYWLINLLAKNKDKGQAAGGGGARPLRPPAERPRDDRIQNEIDIFLQEVGGGREIEKQQQREEDVFVEIVPEEEQRRPRRPLSPTIQSRQQRQLADALQNMEEQIPSTRRGSGAESAEGVQPGRFEPGSGVRSHVSEHMREGMVAQHVEQHLANDVDRSVQRHLGATIGEDPTSRAGKLPERTHAIVRLLRNPAGVRQAILMNEILSSPKGLRRSS